MCWSPFFTRRRKISRISPDEYAFLSLYDQSYYNMVYYNLAYDWKVRYKMRFFVLHSSMYRQRTIAEIENMIDELNINFSQRAQRNMNKLTNQEAVLAASPSCYELPVAEAIKPGEPHYATIVIC